MQMTLVGIVLLALWLAVALRGASSAAFLTLLAIPLGAAAIVNIPGSGLSILALQGLATLTTLLVLLQLLARGRGAGADLPLAAWLLGLLCLYGAVTAFVIPRIFVNEILVVPYQRAVTGVRISEFFFTTLVPLVPRPANISQPGYLAASFAFFLVMLWVAQLKGPEFLSKALLTAAGVNAALGMLDILQLDALLAYLRTADYALATNWSILGADRLVGGFPEPSSFGSVSAIFAAYGLSIFLDRRDLWAGLIGITNAVFAVLALSTTGLLGISILGAWILVRLLRDIISGRSGRRAGTILVLSLPIVIALGAVIILTPAGQYLHEMADRLIFSKSDSASGLERRAWAAEGVRVFRETYGFGAGLGSVRSNGLVPVMLANVGWPGLLLFAGFIWLVFLKPIRLKAATPEATSSRVLFRAALTGAIVALAMMSTTAVIADPGIFFFALAAIALSVRLANQQSTVWDGTPSMSIAKRPGFPPTRSGAG